MDLGERKQKYLDGHWTFIPNKLQTLSVLSTKSVKDLSCSQRRVNLSLFCITVHVCIKLMSSIHTNTPTCMKVHIYILYKSHQHAATDGLESWEWSLFKRRENRIQMRTHNPGQITETQPAASEIHTEQWNIYIYFKKAINLFEKKKKKRIKVLICELEQVKEKVLSRTVELDINYIQQITKTNCNSDQMLGAINYVSLLCCTLRARPIVKTEVSFGTKEEHSVWC